jgi:hypothetical protein
MESNVRILRPLSVRNEIDFQIRQLHSLGIQPTLIRMSLKASGKFVMENRTPDFRISNAPKLYVGPRCLCHIIYRDQTVRWVKVEGIPKDEFEKLRRSGIDPLNHLYGI